MYGQVATGIFRKGAVIKFLLLVCFICAHPLQSAGKSWFVSLDTGGFYDSNLTNASRNRDTVEDEGYFVNFSLDKDWEPTRFSLLTATVIAETERYDTVSEFNSSSFGGELSYSWQNRFGFLSPFYKVSVGLLEKYADYDDLDGNKYYFQAVVNRRVLDSLTAHAGYRYEVMDAEEEVFSTKEHKVFLNLEYFIGKRMAAYATAGYKTGDVVSSAQGVFCNGLPATDIYPLIKYSDVIETNHALNSHFCGDWFSYRLDADTTSLTLGVNYQFNLGVSFDLSALLVNSEVSDQIEYQREIYRAGIVVGF